MDYGEILSNVHTQIFNLIRADSNIRTAKVQKIVDGYPKEMTRYNAYPLIIVHTPEGSEDDISNDAEMYEGTYTITIEVYSKTEKGMRQVADAVRNCIRTNRSQITGITPIKLRSGDYTTVLIGNNRVHLYTLNYEFKIVGGR